jgi:membrane associated rhomboid family serine protease
MYTNPTNPLFSLRQFFQGRSASAVLIIINLAVFVLINLAELFLWLFQIPHSGGIAFLAFWLSVPAYLPELMLRPWGLFTYMFTQEGFLHLLFNMYMLYFGGQLFKNFLNDRKLVSVYIGGGIAGALIFILAYNVFPVFANSLVNSLAIGASASVLAVLVAVATFAPNFEIQLLLIGRVKLKYVALAFVAIDLLTMREGNAGGHIAHIGGAIWGFLYITLFQQQRYTFDLLTKPFRNLFRPDKPKKSNFKSTYHNPRPVSDEDFNARKVEEQKKTDEILDKISRYGYDRLSREEKEFLFRSGKK